MTAYDRGWLAQITSAEKYVRRCNGHPAEGCLVTGVQLRAVLANSDESEDVKVYDDGSITWHATAGLFSAEPVQDEPQH